MPLIDMQGREIADAFHLSAEGAEPGPGAIVTLARLALGAPLPRPLGVMLEPSAPIAAVAAHLASLDLICVSFPKFRDGRGFTLARALRERYGFTGRIRAVGPVLPDQLQALTACGVSEIETSVQHPPAQWAGFVAQETQLRAHQLLNRLVNRAATN
jgi:uncharacterized protein (DUF934 family)